MVRQLRELQPVAEAVGRHAEKDTALLTIVVAGCPIDRFNKGKKKPRACGSGQRSGLSEGK
jgi:hypothetical protein